MNQMDGRDERYNALFSRMQEAGGVGMNDMKAVRHLYKQRYDFAASEVVGAFDELRSLDWSLEIHL
ncbi:hypothetical protein [Escherichia coli]